MNTNQKKLKLIKEGFKASTLQYLSDKQINALFNRLQEQVSSVVEPAKKGYKIGEKGGNLPAAPKGYNINKNPDGTIMAIPNEQNELGEDTVVDKDDEDKGEVSQDPVQVQGPDGMDDDSDSQLQEKFQSKSQQKYFFAKCNDKSQTKKLEISGVEWLMNLLKIPNLTNYLKRKKKQKKILVLMITLKK